MNLASLVSEALSKAGSMVDGLVVDAVYHRHLGSSYDTQAGRVTADTVTSDIGSVLMRSFKEEERTGDVEPMTDKKLFVDGLKIDFEPSTDDYLTINERRWNVHSWSQYTGRAGFNIHVREA